MRPWLRRPRPGRRPRPAQRATTMKEISMNRTLGLILAVAVAGALAAASQAGNRSTQHSPRYGALHVAKERSAYPGLAAQLCTITSSNLRAIKVGSKVVYASAAGGPRWTVTSSSIRVTTRPSATSSSIRGQDGHGHVSGGTGQLTGSARALQSRSIQRPVSGTGTGDSGSRRAARTRTLPVGRRTVARDGW